MVTIFQNLLDHKRAELDQAKIRYEELQRDVAALERAASMQLPPSLFAEAPAPAMPKLSKKEKHALRERQIIELFHRSGGMLHLSTIMKELHVSKNAAKDWMNVEIDRAPMSCPWERVDGNKSRFIFKEDVRRQSPLPEPRRNDSAGMVTDAADPPVSVPPPERLPDTPLP